MVQRPLESLHVRWEYWVGSQHYHYPAEGPWLGVGSVTVPDDLLPIISMNSWTHFAPFFAAMNISTGAGVAGRTWSEARFADTRSVLREMLQDAYQETATYLYLALDPLVE